MAQCNHRLYSIFQTFVKEVIIETRSPSSFGSSSSPRGKILVHAMLVRKHFKSHLCKQADVLPIPVVKIYCLMVLDNFARKDLMGKGLKVYISRQWSHP